MVGFLGLGEDSGVVRISARLIHMEGTWKALESRTTCVCVCVCACLRAFANAKVVHGRVWYAL